MMMFFSRKMICKKRFDLKSKNPKQFLLKHLLICSLILIFSFSKIGITQQLSPGDGVKLTFYNISDAVSGDYFVQKDWKIQFPYIGLLGVRNQDFDNIRVEIINRYKIIYRDLEIQVQPQYKINILGEVKNPGVYYVSGVEKLSDLLALAGGETRDTNLNKIYLLSGRDIIDINAKEILQNGKKLTDLGLQSGDQIYVSRKKWISRNIPVIIYGGSALITTFLAVLRN